MQRPLRPGVALSLLVLFLLSGATSLVYQVLWVRQLSLVLGSTLHAISAVVGAFMAGLALGSVLFGALVDRGGSPLRLYAILEGAIGVCALAIPRVFEALGSSGFAAGWLPFVVSFVLLLVPTALMGGTLPALARFVSTFPGTRGRLIGTLYALNTTGAILGAALTGFVLIRALGIEQTTLVTAVCNVGIMFAGLLVAKLAVLPIPAANATQAPQRSAEPKRHLLFAVTLAYFVSGFVGLGLEVVWTRAILLFSGNTIYAFTVILTTFLLGLTLGSSVMSALLHRLDNAASCFAGLQCLIGLVAGLTPFVLAGFGVPLFQWVQAKAAPMGLAAQAFSSYAISASFMLPATILMGACFPLVARIVTESTLRVGQAIGRAYAINTLGAVLGSLLSSLVFIPLLGIQKSILLFAFLSAGAGFYLAWRARATPCLCGGLVSVLVLAVALALSPGSFRAMLEDSLRERLDWYSEGLETTVGVFDSSKAGRPVLLINNVALDDHGIVHKMLAHLPMLLHPAPQRGLVLGFGVGITSQSLASHGLAVNHCVEISQDVMDAAPWFTSLNGGIANRNDPQFEVFVEDGRRFLLANRQPYDLIALDANSGKLRNAGVGKLYTREFFELCRNRLSPDGLVTAYVSPNGTLQEFKMIVRTFTAVFPNTTLWLDPVYGETCVLVGSQQALRIDVDRYLARIHKPAVQADLAAFDLDHPGMLLASFYMGEAMVHMFAQDGEINTDDRPNMEFYPLDMDLFDADDSPLSAAGLPLYEESVFAFLKPARDQEVFAEVRDYVASAERASGCLSRAWEARRSGSEQESMEWIRLAASIHPEGEYLRTQLGYGRSAATTTVENLQRESSPENLAAAGLLAAQRGRTEQAVRLIEAALAVEAPGEPVPRTTRGDLHLAAAECSLHLDDFAGCHAHIVEAAALGEDVRLLRAELALQEEGAEAASMLLSEFRGRKPETRDMSRVLDLLVSLGRSGVHSAELLELLAEAFEVCGDVPGAFLAYRKAAGLSAASPSRMLASAAALRLGLSLDVFRRAYGLSADPAPILTSRFGAGRVSQAEVPSVNYRDASTWMQLSSIYRRVHRPLLTYHLARAARTIAPENVDTYLLLAQAASLVGGGRPIALQALDRAQSLSAGDERVRTALYQLKSNL